MHAGIIGGGVCGLTAAIRLAQRGAQVDLFEAAPREGGRTRSYFEKGIGQWVDNGPHLISGAYQDTGQLLAEAGALDMLTWQDSLNLPLWDRQRGHFTLAPSASLPLALAMPLASACLPGHGWSDITAMLRMAGRLKRPVDGGLSAGAWLESMHLPTALIRDLLEPMCLGAMNEPLERANAASFSRVLNDAFADHGHARLGWFNRPLSEALVQPLQAMAESLGVRMHSSCRIRAVQANNSGAQLGIAGEQRQFDACILALPLRRAQQLLGLHVTAVTRRISNIHMWFTEMPALPHPFIGGIGTTGQWFFDVTSQMPGQPRAEAGGKRLRHICAVISADEQALRDEKKLAVIIRELAEIEGNGKRREPYLARVVSEHHATVSVHSGELDLPLPDNVISACEAPLAGDIPATIEAAVRRANHAAEQCYLQYIR